MSRRAVTVEDLGKFERLSDVQIHPDGHAFVYIKTQVNDNDSFKSHLYVGSLDSKDGEQWTFGNVRDQSPRYSPNGGAIVFLSNRSGTNQLWMVKTTGGEPQQLTFLRHGAGVAEWSPDGRSLLFSAPVLPDVKLYNEGELTKEKKKEENELKQKEPLRITRIKYKSDSRGFHDETFSQLLLYSLDTKEIAQLTYEAYDHQAGAWHPNGKKISYSANKHGDLHLLSDVFTFDLDTKTSEQLSSSDGIYTLPKWSPDGSQLSYVGHNKAFAGSTQTEIFVKTEDVLITLTEDLDLQFPDSMISDFNSSQGNPGYVWIDENNIMTTASRYGKTGLFTVSLDQQLATLYEENTHVYEYSYHRGNGTTLLGISGPTEPGNIYRLDDNKPTPLTDANRALLAELSLSEPITHRFTAEDGWEVEGWLLKPYNFDPTHKYPLILEVHGGPHAMYGYAFFHELQVLAARGYAVLYTNPRGGYGYGQTFVDAVRGDYGGKDYTDLMSAVEQTLDANDWIDKENLGVTGGSYGGFMTNWIVSHTDRFKAAVTQRSISNWLSFYGVSDIGYYFTKWEIGKNLLEDPQTLWNHSPLKYADQVNTPLLILHGEQDYRCPIEQAEQLFTTLKHHGKETEFVRFPNANHELSRSGPPALRKKRLQEIISWFEKYIPVKN